jgi:hypothetical protein
MRVLFGSSVNLIRIFEKCVVKCVLGTCNIKVHVFKEIGLCLQITGRSLHCQVENHVRTKFATPILYAIDNSKNYDIFSMYT